MKTWLSAGCRAALLLWLAGSTTPVGADPFRLVSTIDPLQESPAGGSGDSAGPILSPDGRYVLFASTANNLVLNSSSNPIPVLIPPRLNVYLRDRTNGTTTLVSANLAGTGGGNGDSLPTDLSSNGCYALFESSASDLVPDDTNNLSDIFLRDLVTGTTLLVNVSTNGGMANGTSRSSVMTPDGRYVAFVSEANNLVPGDTNRIADVFVRDMQSNVTALVSVGALSTNRTWPIGGSEAPDITPDGRYVAFFSSATNLLPPTTIYPLNYAIAGEIYVRDLATGTTRWASSNALSVYRYSHTISYNHALSADGQFVVFEANPSPVLSFPASGAVIRYNLQTGTADVLSTNAIVPFRGYEDIHTVDMTPDGRFIAFVANTNSSYAATCVYLWDAQIGRSTLVSGDLSNRVPSGAVCDVPTVDPTGRFVAFLSKGSNLVTNALAGGYHLYVRDLQAGSTTLVDADTNGVGSFVSTETVPCLSADGRFVAFECRDGNLVPNDRNHDFDVFVRDLTTNTTELISARDPTLASLTPNGPSRVSPVSLSANGRFVAFSSDADNLFANDTNGFRDVFVRDLLLGTNLLASVATNGVASGHGSSTDSAISADGRYVAFTSSADDLVPGDTNKAQDVFIRDLQSGSTALVSVNLAGTGPGNGASYSPLISAEARYVLFRSKAGNLAPGTFTGGENLFWQDLQSATTTAVTTSGALAAAMTPDGRFVAFGVTNAIGLATNLCVWDSHSSTRIYTNAVGGLSSVAISPGGEWVVYAVGRTNGLYAVDLVARTNWFIGSNYYTCRQGLRFSRDGQWLAYATSAAQANNDTNGTYDVYLYDFRARTNLLVSRSPTSGGAADAASDSPDISPDGRFVAYRSAASDIVPNDNNGVPDVFLYDRLSGATTLLSASRFGNSTADNRSFAPVFSGDGQTLVFQSWASDLVGQDFNHTSDLFAVAFFYAAISPANTAGQGPWLSWPFEPAKNYRVQYKATLDEANWHDLTGAVTNDGMKAYLQDPAPASTQRFYRILAL